MMTLTLKTLLIWSALIALALMLISLSFKLIKRFLKIWFLVILVLIVIKFTLNPAWLSAI